MALFEFGYDNTPPIVTSESSQIGIGRHVFVLRINYTGVL